MQTTVPVPEILSLFVMFAFFYVMQKNLNDALMGILRVRNLISPPYISIEPSLNLHRISKSDHFVIVGSDGLFDFFSNDEAVMLVHSYILSNPNGDPAKFLLEQLVGRAADCAGKIFNMASSFFLSFFLISFIINKSLQEQKINK
jgi:serine/threonine protein phosphatase PrpC